MLQCSVSIAAAGRTAVRQSHGRQSWTGLQDNVLPAFMHPGAHAVTASCRNFDFSKKISRGLVNGIKHLGTVASCIGVDQHVTCDHHGDQVSGSGIAYIESVLIDETLDSFRCFTCRNHPSVFTRVHVNCGDSAIGRLVQRDSFRVTRGSGAGAIGILGEGAAGRGGILQIRFFSWDQSHRAAGGMR